VDFNPLSTNPAGLKPNFFWVATKSRLQHHYSTGFRIFNPVTTRHEQKIDKKCIHLVFGKTWNFFDVSESKTNDSMPHVDTNKRTLSIEQGMSFI
jgi:hypothetical protein